MPPRTASAIALAATFSAAPVTGSLNCRGAGAVDGVADDVADGVALGVTDGAGVGLVDGVGVVLGVGLGVADGFGADGLGVGAGVGLVDGVGAGADGLGLGAGVGVGAGLGVGSGVGVGVGVNPALPPDSRRTTRVLTSQDLSWEVMVAESLHGPGSAGSTPTFSWSRAFSP